MDHTISEIEEANRNRTVALLDGRTVPCLGQGTWHLAQNPGTRKNEVETLRLGIRLGMTLIDTAEMYGEGASERLVGEAIQGITRSNLFLVSKVYPHNAGRSSIFQSCKKSIQRLGVSYLDLYLLHWRGRVPLTETVACMEELVKMGLIRGWGVSNFDTDDMQELWSVPGGTHCLVNQVLYHLGSRGIEYSLLPWMEERKIPLMAYCPLAQGGSLRRGLLENLAVNAVASAHHVSPLQIVLSFAMRSGKSIAIPMTRSLSHVRENAEAGLIQLTPEDLKILSEIYPPPRRKLPLDML
jgi:diketogulonate reductase-like aldo/keto reductase